MEEFVSYETYDMISHIKEYIFSNDYNSIKKLLDAIGVERGFTQYFSDRARTTISKLLAYASAQATYDQLSEEIALELIARSASVISPLDFLNVMLCYIDYKRVPNVTLPARLVYEFYRPEPSEHFYSMVCSLSEDRYLMLIDFIVEGKIKTPTAISRSTLPALLTYAYRNHVLPGDIFFAYLASNLTGVDDGFFETQRAIGNEDDIFGEDDEDYDD